MRPEERWPVGRVEPKEKWQLMGTGRGRPGSEASRKGVQREVWQRRREAP